ncbi:hypothetical protein ABG067_007095 [Albugo candida]
MWSRDFWRVLQGATIVASKALEDQVPTVINEATRLSKHASELAHLPKDVLRAMQSQRNERPNSADTCANSVPIQNSDNEIKRDVADLPNAKVHEIQTNYGSNLQQSTSKTVAEIDAAARKDHEQFFKRSIERLHETGSSGESPIPMVKPKSEESKPHVPMSSKCDLTGKRTDKNQQQISLEVTNSVSDKDTSSRTPISEERKHTTADLPSFEFDHPIWKERQVPSSPLSRIIGFGSLAAKLAVGTATEIVKSGGKSGAYGALMSDANVEKLAETLCTMRGAALKLGQMLSIQDENLVPSKLSIALDRVRQNANVMPKAQLHAQLETELGQSWSSHFKEFDDNPIAAASIGQVHRAILTSGDRVAIKVQYPGVAESIESDLTNLKRLVTYTNILPRGLYIDEIIRVGKEELTLECDYKSEAKNQDYFRMLVNQSGMEDEFLVPRVYHDLSTSRVLTTELISGIAIDKASELSQTVRNTIARRILELTMRELFDWKFMQTDPNWSNFMYDGTTNKIGLIDFGAAREYGQEFVKDYFNVVWAAANHDEQKMLQHSIKMRFLTGDESQTMLQAHVAAGMVVGEPFLSSKPFDFSQSHLTKRLAQHTETFVHGRLTPPPQEVYSLHRKLAGAFLICIKLKAVITCRDVLEKIHEKYYNSES